MSILSSGLAKLGISKGAQQRLTKPLLVAAAPFTGGASLAALPFVSDNDGAPAAPALALPGAGAITPTYTRDSVNSISQELTRTKNELQQALSRGATRVSAAAGKSPAQHAPASQQQVSPRQAGGLRTPAPAGHNTTLWIAGGVGALVLVVLLVVLVSRK